MLLHDLPAEIVRAVLLDLQKRRLLTALLALRCTDAQSASHTNDFLCRLGWSPIASLVGCGAEITTMVQQCMLPTVCTATAVLRKVAALTACTQIEDGAHYTRFLAQQHKDTRHVAVMVKTPHGRVWGLADDGCHCNEMELVRANSLSVAGVTCCVYTFGADESGATATALLFNGVGFESGAGLPDGQSGCPGALGNRWTVEQGGQKIWIHMDATNAEGDLVGMDATMDEALCELLGGA